MLAMHCWQQVWWVLAADGVVDLMHNVLQLDTATLLE
jgi:hypothetical protein